MESEKIYDIVIVGAGPAGVSASLYTAGAGFETLVLGNGASSLAKAELIGNYYGFGRVTGKELLRLGIEGAEEAGVSFRTCEVTGASYDGAVFVSETDAGGFSSRALLLATGVSRKKPPIDGIEEFEGRGVSYCAVCDAFFCRGKNVCVIGGGAYALSEASVLANVAKSVTLLTNGVKTDGSPFPVTDKKIKALGGDEAVGRVIFADGNAFETDRVFIAEGTAGSAQIAVKLGALTENGIIKTDANGATSIPGLYAAGDCTGGIYQVSVAVGKGAAAGMAAARFLRERKKG